MRSTAAATAVIDDLAALALERTHPLGDARRLAMLRGVAGPALDARDREQCVELLVAQLREQAREERAARLADARVAGVCP